MIATLHNKSFFPIGYHQFHKNQIYNFQLNRWYSLGVARFDDVEEIGKKVKTFEDWKMETVKQAEKAVSENRLLNAAFHYRSAEFYTMPADHPAKEYYYDKFIALFYKAIEGETIERIQVPHESVFLPAIRITPEKDRKGIILLHGGFDAFLEEWFYIMKYLSQNGYEVIGFEGPGQGNVILKQKYPLDYRWEKPVQSILDYLKIDQATLLGLSMGGWLCLRASAFEPRIKNVIASGHACDYMKIPPAMAQWLMLFFFKFFKNYTNNSMLKMINKGGMQSWQLNQLMHITKLDSPIEALEFAMKLNEQNLHAELVKQDVLYLTGRNDHFIPFKMHRRQMKLLTHAASITDRVFNKNEHAQNHCQIGNIKLMLDTIIDWLKLQ